MGDWDDYPHLDFVRNGGVVKLKKKKMKTHHVTCDSRVRQVKLESCTDGRMVPGALSLTGVVHLMFLNGES